MLFVLLCYENILQMDRNDDGTFNRKEIKVRTSMWCFYIKWYCILLWKGLRQVVVNRRSNPCHPEIYCSIKKVSQHLVLTLTSFRTSILSLYSSSFAQYHRVQSENFYNQTSYHQRNKFRAERRIFHAPKKCDFSE